MKHIEVKYLKDIYCSGEVGPHCKGDIHLIGLERAKVLEKKYPGLLEPVDKAISLVPKVVAKPVTKKKVSK